MDMSAFESMVNWIVVSEDRARPRDFNSAQDSPEGELQRVAGINLPKRLYV